ncbi:MAG TPA: hypothetical protein VKU40_03580 [Thermoanaerobaculia bacterium]|nr:hypothetical protein [Thermoanaerobaculia bacterium]
MSDETTKQWWWQRCWAGVDARTARRYSYACIAWVASYGFAIYTIKHDLVTATWARWAVGALPTLFGIVLVYNFIRYLRQLDELQRRIQVDALAFAFGIGFLFMTGYRVCERLGAPQLDTDDPLLPMVFAWTIATWWGTRRYS